MARTANRGSSKAPALPDLRTLPDARLDFIAPMLAKLVEKLPEGPAWQYEVKLDGYRAMVLRASGGTSVFSRRGNILNSTFPPIARAFDALDEGTMVDGEIVALDAHGRPVFNLLQHWRDRRPLYYYTFDLLAYRGKDLRRLPLAERRRLLEQFALNGIGDPVRLSPILEANAQQIVRAAREQNLEGVVAKNVESIYQSGERTGAWVKYKTNRGQEFVIGGYKPGSHGFESLLAGYYDDARLLFIGKVKNGFTPALREQVARRFAGLETNQCPFANLPEPKNARRGEALTAEAMKNYRWLKPVLVAQVEFTEWTEANHLRHSRFAGLREDKEARDVRRETPAHE